MLQLLDILLLGFFLLGVTVADGNTLLGGFETKFLHIELSVDRRNFVSQRLRYK